MDTENAYKAEAEELINWMLNDEVSAKHIPVEDPQWRDGYINGYIVGRKAQDKIDKYNKTPMVRDQNQNACCCDTMLICPIHWTGE